MKKALVKIIWIFMILILLMQNSIIYALTEKEELQQEQSKINNQLKEMEKKQDELEKQKSKAMKAVENLIDQVAESEEEIGKLKNQISNLEEQITSKKDDIEHKEEEYNEQEKLLDKRLIAIYKNGETSYLDLLLSSNKYSCGFKVCPFIRISKCACGPVE